MKLPQTVKIEEHNKIITVLCCLLKNVGILTENDLIEIVTVDDIVPHFGFIDAITTIEDKNMATLNRNKGYCLTEKGLSWADEFEGTVPRLLLAKLYDVGREVMKISSLKNTARWGVSEKDGNWLFTVNFFNELDKMPFIDVNVYFRKKDDALKAEKTFLDNPSGVLGNVMKNFM